MSVYSEDKIRIAWKSVKTTKTPPINKTILLFEMQNVKIEGQIKEDKDYQETMGIDKKEMDTKIFDFIQKGNTIETVELARKAYDFDNTEAKLFIESLRGNLSKTRGHLHSLYSDPRTAP